MMAEKSKVKWGNRMGYIILPFHIALYEDPLEYIRKAKDRIDRKKHSLEAICSYTCSKAVHNLLGAKVNIQLYLSATHSALLETNLTFMK